MSWVLILGATSTIARAVGSELAKSGYSLYLAGRDEEELDRIARDFRIRFPVEVVFSRYDIDQADPTIFLNQVLDKVHELYGVVFAIGELGKQSLSIREFSEAKRIIHRNFTGACMILGEVANLLEQQKKGFIIGISSVAGDRGRQSNYIYGAAKGGFSLFLQGLRNHLYPFGIQVLTIKLGFVDTSMTFGKEGLFLVAEPSYVGKAIVKALEKRKDIVYIPWFWRWIMWIIKSIPETIFKRLQL